MPQASGQVKVDSKAGRLEINANLDHLQPANKFGVEYLTYVLWAITPEGRPVNLGEVLLTDGRSELQVTTDLQAFGMIVTAEPYFSVVRPSNLDRLAGIRHDRNCRALLLCCPPQQSGGNGKHNPAADQGLGTAH
jgi:hypothetical protein